jgi:hypothetical protein
MDLQPTDSEIYSTTEEALGANYAVHLPTQMIQMIQMPNQNWNPAH